MDADVLLNTIEGFLLVVFVLVLGVDLGCEMGRYASF